ncbi:MAG TPA: glycosyltransferase [Hanamia sp.]|nr:glycosyltransferase [Hanamia sp.]
MHKVLFLASWFPSKVDPFNGDFIERHAKAISLNNQVFVIYVVKDPSIKNGITLVNKQFERNLISFIGYYPKFNSPIRWIEKLHSNYHAVRLQNKIFKTILKEYGMPDIIHLNVLMKAGIFARRLNKKYSLPYVLSENWTGYYPERNDGFLSQDFWYRKMSKSIYKNCTLPLPVTKDLGERMNNLFGIQKAFKVIPNVVDTSLFYPSFENKNLKKRFIHISTLGYHKNIWGILNTTKKLFEARKDFELHLAGNASPEIINWTKENNVFNTCIFFKGLISYKEVAVELRKSDVLVMFSRYENLPCVILEALCSGLPVISTDVGGIREVIDEENGVLIESENEDQLLEAMNNMLENFGKYDKQKIAAEAKEKFNYQTVANQFQEAYKEVLGR